MSNGIWIKPMPRTLKWISLKFINNNTTCKAKSLLWKIWLPHFTWITIGITIPSLKMVTCNNTIKISSQIWRCASLLLETMKLTLRKTSKTCFSIYRKKIPWRKKESNGTKVCLTLIKWSQITIIITKKNHE